MANDVISHRVSLAWPNIRPGDDDLRPPAEPVLRPGGRPLREHRRRHRLRRRLPEPRHRHRRHRRRRRSRSASSRTSGGPRPTTRTSAPSCGQFLGLHIVHAGGPRSACRASWCATATRDPESGCGPRWAPPSGSCGRRPRPHRTGGRRRRAYGQAQSRPAPGPGAPRRRIRTSACAGRSPARARARSCSSSSPGWHTIVLGTAKPEGSCEPAGRPTASLGVTQGGLSYVESRCAWHRERAGLSVSEAVAWSWTARRPRAPASPRHRARGRS